MPGKGGEHLRLQSYQPAFTSRAEPALGRLFTLQQPQSGFDLCCCPTEIHLSVEVPFLPFALPNLQQPFIHSFPVALAAAVTPVGHRRHACRMLTEENAQCFPTLSP